MRVARVVTNETCNQNCGFCSSRRPVERADLVREAAARVVTEARGRPQELVLAGGEPTMRRDLAALVEIAKQRGVPRVALETNAALVDPAMARSLRDAGLDVARTKIPAWGEDYERITRDEGGFERMLRGLAALVGAGVEVEAIVPIVRDNLALVGELPGALARHAPGIRTLVVRVPQEPGEHEAALAPLPTAAAAALRVVMQARRFDLGVRMDAGAFVPPCLFESPGRVSSLYALNPGSRARAGFEQVPGCSECALRDHCPGFPVTALRRGDGLAARPITEERTRRRLTLISTEQEQIARELVTREVHRGLDGTSAPLHTVRVNFRCNQSCSFCFVSTHLPAASDEDVRAAITEAARAGASLSLSGGEPTLNPRLAEYVRFAKQAGVRQVELQTNATRLSDPALVSELREAGVDVAFVSLHGSRAEISDRVTGAPGTFEQTVRGIDRIIESGIALRLNFVHSAPNTEDFPDYVRLVAARWPGATLTVSVVAPSTDLVPQTPELIPRYSEIRPRLAEGIRLARSAGLAVTGFESMCAVPLCLVPDEVREYLLLPEVPPGSGGGEFVKVTACESCRVNERCWGVRRRYLDLFGPGELSPIA